MKTKYGLNNTYRAGFDTIQKRKSDLQRLHILNEKLEKLDIANTTTIFELQQTVHPLLFPTRVSFIATKDACYNQLIDGINPQTDDYNNIMRGPFTGPSFEWRETNYRIADDKIHAEHGDFIINSAFIDYLRYPIEMDIAGYKHFDNKASADVQCELPAYLHGEIIDQAVMEYDLWVRNPNYQFAAIKKTVNE